MPSRAAPQLPRHAEEGTVHSTGALWAVGACLSVPLLAHAYLGTFVRYVADDYGNAAAARQCGVLGSVCFWWYTWSGRFSSYLASALACSGGPGTARALPALLLICWLVAVTFALARAGGLGLPCLPLPGRATLASLVVFATLEGCPALEQSLYWQTGVLTYVLPLVLMTGYLGWVAIPRPWTGSAGDLLRAMGSGTFAFFAGATSETSAVLQAALISAALVPAAMRCRRSAATRGTPVMLAAGGLGAVAGLALMAMAPGNRVRAESYPGHLPLAGVAALSLLHAAQFLWDSVSHNRLAMAMALVLPGALLLLFGGGFGPRDAGRGRALGPLALIPGFALLAVALCAVPSLCAISRMPPARSLVIPQYILVCSAVLWSLEWGALVRGIPAFRRVHPRVVAASCALAVAVSAIASFRATRRIAARVPQFREWASAWDAQDLQIRGARRQGARVLSLPLAGDKMGSRAMGLGCVGRDPTRWLNRAVADYYDATSIRSR